MAKSEHTSSNAAITDNNATTGQCDDSDSIPELSIEIYPGGYDEWLGSCEQIKGEDSLVPPDLDWPEGKEDRCWSADGFDYWLRRCRPPGMKGPMKKWVDGDYWRLRRTLSSQACDGFAAAIIYQKRCELEWALWKQTPAAAAQWDLYRKAQQDKRFQAFLALSIGNKQTTRG